MSVVQPLPKNSSVQSGPFCAITDRTLAGLRLILSVSALFIVVIDPTESNSLFNLTSYVLIAYIVYSVVLYAFARQRKNFSFRTMRYFVWIDVLWYSGLITLGKETNAVFFFFYLFAIIAGSSRGGTKLGLALTAACTALFLTLSLLLVTQLQLDVPRMARRAVYMAVLGYILAYWGGAEAMLRGRLALLKELLTVANPRFGVDRTICCMLRKLMQFYDADYCFLLLGDSDSDLDYYHTTKITGPDEVAPLKIRNRAEFPLINSFSGTVAVYAERVSLWNNQPSYRSCDPANQTYKELPVDSAANTAEALNVRSFITSPLKYRERVGGRILVGSSDPRLFNVEDGGFLQQVADQILPLIENIRIVDHLASDAAEEERRRIARSVHDRVIQPYLGMQLGLKALQQELSPEQLQRPTAAMNMLDQLVYMTREGIDELRQYIGELKRSHADATPLTQAIRRFAGSFERGTGIHVDIVDESCRLTMNDRLAAEVFQMTAEALSNVHKHTRSRKAEIRLLMANNTLQLIVGNDTDAHYTPPAFRPRSIFERAEALGARSEIMFLNKQTLVRVEVPL
jgi:signal transduction histidine kinase